MTTQTYPRKLDYQVLALLAGHRAIGLQVRPRPAPAAVAALWRDGRALWAAASRLVGHALQAEPGHGGKHLLPGPLRGRAAARGLGQRGLFGPGAHAGRFGQSSLRAAGGLSGRGRDPDARAAASSKGCASGARRWPATWQTYGPFAATEPLLMALAKAGANRQEMHERIREVQHGGLGGHPTRRGESLVDMLADDPAITAYLSPGQVRDIMEHGAGVGDAPARCHELVEAIRQLVTGTALTTPGAEQDGIVNHDRRIPRCLSQQYSSATSWPRARPRSSTLIRSKDDVVYMVHKDGLTAGDGARRSVLPGKGKLSCRTTSNVFYLLEDEGVDTHYIGMVGREHEHRDALHHGAPRSGHATHRHRLLRPAQPARSPKARVSTRRWSSSFSRTTRSTIPWSPTTRSWR